MRSIEIIRERKERECGVLLPVFSLPSPSFCGNLGQEAFRFVDFLADGGFSCWQLLPHGPTGVSNSPYQSFSLFAGNPYFIDLREAVESAWLSEETASSPRDERRVDYGRLYHERLPLLEKLWQGFRRLAGSSEKEAFQRFMLEEKAWLDPYRQFMSFRDRFSHRPLKEWPEDARFDGFAAFRAWGEEGEQRSEFHAFLQYLFFKQWHRLRLYARSRGVRLMGDLPIYAAEDSAELWAFPELFQLDGARRPVAVAGFPPLSDGERGQRWGNPLYRWQDEKGEKNQALFDWWASRFRHGFRLYDQLRLDHFRAFHSYWSIAADASDAASGTWMPGPGAALFENGGRVALAGRAAGKSYPPFIAEDLGAMTEEVRNLRDQLAIPGMRVLRYGFDPDGQSENLPHNLNENSLYYFGTHDNETLRGWWEKASPQERDFARAYFGLNRREGWRNGLLRGLLGSPARMVILQMQDLLDLGDEARMNIPGESSAWSWRIRAAQFSEEALRKQALSYRKQLWLYGRAPS